VEGFMNKFNKVTIVLLVGLFSAAKGMPIFDDGTGRDNYFDAIKKYHFLVNDKHAFKSSGIYLDLINKEAYGPRPSADSPVEKLTYLKEFLRNEGFYPYSTIEKKIADLKEKSKTLEGAAVFAGCEKEWKAYRSCMAKKRAQK